MHFVLVFFIQLFGLALDVVNLMQQRGDAIFLQINANTVVYLLAQKVMQVNKKKDDLKFNHLFQRIARTMRPLKIAMGRRLI